MVARDDSFSGWEERVALILRLELKRQRLTAADLAGRLSAKNGSEVTVASIHNKLSRGKFGAAFLFASLEALDCDGPAVARLFEMVRD
jgi:hypothetical protein